MGEMVESVARAIYEGRNGKGCRAWGSLPAAHKAPYLADSRAAIAAMREPTFDPDRVSYHAGMTRRDWWAAMVDAALAEGA